MIKGVIFDLDGTVLNTIEDLADAMNYMLRQFGYPEKTDIKHHKQSLGYGARRYVQSCLPEEAAADGARVDDCLRVYREFYEAHTSVKTRPFDGIAEVMQRLKELGIPCCILSNKPDISTRVLAEKWFSDYSLACAYGERNGIPRKPDPAGAVAIANELGLLPEEFAFVGDSEVDIKTAVNAGMVPVGVLWGFRTREQLEEAGARYLLEKPADLISLIK